MKVIHDTASEFWTGHGWLVIREEGEPAIGSFQTEEQARDAIADLACDCQEKPLQ